MFDISKMAINDLLKDFVKKPLKIKGTIENLHPDYNVDFNLSLQSIKKVKDKDIPKNRGLAK